MLFDKYQNIKRLAAQTISICANVKFDIPVGKEEVNVCKAIEDMKLEAHNEGRDEGKTEIVLEMLKENQPLDFISRISKYSKEKITEIGRMHGIL